MKLRHLLMLLLTVAVVGGGLVAAKYLTNWLDGGQEVPGGVKVVKRVAGTADLVWVATRGKDINYHRHGCPEGAGGRPIPIDEAVKQGYKPCPKCFK